MSDTYLSRKAYEEFKEKLDHLKTVKRRGIAKAIGEAREHGDLRENAGYHEAKKEQSLNEARIAELEEKLHQVLIIDDKNITKDSVVIGSKVKLKNLESKKTLEYTVVSELEADIFQKKISVTTPLGNALLGGKVKDVIDVNAPIGIIRYKILDIS